MALRFSTISNRASFSSIKSAYCKSTAFCSPSINKAAKTAFSKVSKPSLCPDRLVRGFSLSRVPSELGALQSMMPLHSAVAAARMTSCLSSTSRSCMALSQELGLSVPR